ncbi:MAG: hypothetical protein ACD_75C01318G0006 [uncultured bacterium]|nr:MAG: hypothetical protein ACD_75C01318G0006 [uncultured bacterium]
MGVPEMKERLERFKVKRESLTIEIKGLARDIREKLNPAMVDDVVDLAVSEAATMMDSLIVKQAEMIALRSKIWELEEALGY